MKKIIIGLLMTFLVMSLVGCTKDKEISINIDDLIKESLDIASFKSEMVELDNGILEGLYSTIDLGDIEIFKVYVAGSGANAEELAVFKANDNKKADKIYKAVKARLEDLQEGFKDYIPEQYKIAQDGVIKKEGKYIFFMLGENVKEIEKVIEKYIEKAK